VVCLALRALKEIVRPQRLSGAVVRPLNFTVIRRHERIAHSLQAPPAQGCISRHRDSVRFCVVNAGGIAIRHHDEESFFGLDGCSHWRAWVCRGAPISSCALPFLQVGALPSDHGGAEN
jgi:hypothetical protein